MTDDQIQFEMWFLGHYEWYITRNRRGYKLDKDTNGDYDWPIAKQDWLVWRAARRIK